MVILMMLMMVMVDGTAVMLESFQANQANEDVC